jgi:hypothetical protein
MKTTQNGLFLPIRSGAVSRATMSGIDIEVVEIVRIARARPALKSLLGAPALFRKPPCHVPNTLLSAIP